MICPNCHANVPEDAQTCPNCRYIFVNYEDEDFSDTIEIPVEDTRYEDTISNSFDSTDLDNDDSPIKQAVNYKTNNDQSNKQEEKKSKRFFSFGKAKKKTPNQDGPSRSNQKQDKNYVASYLQYLAAYIKDPMRQFEQGKFNPNHGFTSLLLLAILNAISFTSLANYFVTHYEWFADLSVLPNLNFDFIAWRFGLKTFVFLVVSLWLLPAITHFFKKQVFEETMHNNEWLTHYYGMNSFTVVIAIICFLFSLLAPLIFLMIVLLITLLQVAMLIITLTISIIQASKVQTRKNFYNIFTILMIFFILEVFLVGLIY